MDVQVSMSRCRSEVLFDKQNQTQMEIIFPEADTFNLPNATPFQVLCAMGTRILQDAKCLSTAIMHSQLKAEGN